jgi:hypothetical protein
MLGLGKPFNRRKSACRFGRKKFRRRCETRKDQKRRRHVFHWTASDNRRVYAFVRGSLIYFGTDAAAIEKCLAIQKGEAESLAANESLSRAYTANNLAFGYVSPEGVKQIAALAGVSVAVEATEEATEEVLSPKFCRRFYRTQPGKSSGRRIKPNAESKT